MIKYLITSIVIGLSSILPSLADESKITKGYYTQDAMGCMLVRECTRDVHEIKSIQDVNKYITETDYSDIRDEFDALLGSLNQIGTKVFLGHPRFFPPGHRGVYHTVSNNFFINLAFMHRPSSMISVVRHEGWHAAQDCMAGTIENNLIAIILSPESVPGMYKGMAASTYSTTPEAIPWEQEAFWAGYTPGMTQKALEACATGNMWEVYPPTPLTKKFLVDEGYIQE